MSDYVVSARKYRPLSFGTLLGQDNISKTLKNSILRGQLSHAYLFCGPRGVGKTSTARIFAKTINCSDPGPEMEPCGKCPSCVSFAEGGSYCIEELDAASNNGVEDIKALMDKVQIPPQTGKYSVYIIDEVHMLSTAAFNAFLKTLEEPPAHAVFILCTTEKHKIPATILSRCQTYDFNRIGIPYMVQNLSSIAAKEGINVDEESLHLIARKADGAMRDALTIFDQMVAFCGSEIRYEDVMRNLNVLDYEYSFRLVDCFLSMDYGQALLMFDEILAKGFNALHFVSALGEHLRDLLVSRTGGLESLLDLPESLRERYSAQASKCSVKFIFEALSVLNQCEAGYKNATNQRLHIEFALMKLSFLADAASVPVQASSMPVRPAVAPEVQEPSLSSARRPSAPGRKTGAGLSLSALMKEEQSSAAPVVEAVDGAVPSDEDIVSKWKELVDTTADKPRLKTALAMAKLEIVETDGVKTVNFSVSNDAQKKWIETQILNSMEATFQKMLSSSKVKILPFVVPEEEKPDKPYMPAEKAKDLMSKNDEVRNLILDLALDIK